MREEKNLKFKDGKSGAAGHIKNLSGANAPLETWASYCIEIGVDKATANRWLSDFKSSVHFLSQSNETHGASESNRGAI